jgi:hypothetical protein
MIIPEQHSPLTIANYHEEQTRALAKPLAALLYPPIVPS